MNGDQDDISSPAGLEGDQELWQLLGRAKPPEVSPYFARRVLRETASLAQTRPAAAVWRGLQAWWQAGLPLLHPPRAAAWPGAGVAAAICAFTALLTFSNGNNLPLRTVSPVWQPAASLEARPSNAVVDAALADHSASPTLTIALDAAAAEGTLTPQDAEVIADLDTLLAREEDHLWTDDSAAY